MGVSYFLPTINLFQLFMFSFLIHKKKLSMLLALDGVNVQSMYLQGVMCLSD